jgi:hypothetical protein
MTRILGLKTPTSVKANVNVSISSKFLEKFQNENNQSLSMRILKIANLFSVIYFIKLMHSCDIFP